MINLDMLAEALDNASIFPAREQNLYFLPYELERKPQSSDFAPKLDLKGARIYSPDLDEYRRDCIYVVDASELDEARARVPAATFAVAGGAEDADDAADGVDGAKCAPVLCMPSESDAASALDRLQCVFERYAVLHDGIVDAIASGRPLSEAVEPCDKILANPIAVFDSTFTLMARTGRYDPEVTDIVWEQVEKHGNADDSPASEPQLRFIEASHGPVLYEIGDTRALQTCIRSGGQSVGFIGSTELYGRFTPGQLSNVWWVHMELERLWPLVSQNENRRDYVQQVVLQVVDGSSPGRSRIERALAQRGWSPDDGYRLLCFHRGADEITEMEQGPTARRIERLMPTAFVIPYEGTILAVLHGGDASTEIGPDGLHEAMERYEFGCVASDVQIGFANLDKAYAQCRAMRAMAAEAEADVKGTAITFDEVFPRYVMEVLGKAGNLGMLCHPQVVALAKRTHGDEFVHSLRLYIVNGCSLSRASRALYVHRSTLVYRIEQVEEMLGTSLADADEGFLLHLYLSCAILEEFGLEAVEG